MILPSAGFGPGRSLRLARARGSRAARDADLGHKAYDHSVARDPGGRQPAVFHVPDQSVSSCRAGNCAFDPPVGVPDRG